MSFNLQLICLFLACFKNAADLLQKTTHKKPLLTLSDFTKYQRKNVKLNI